MVPRDGYFELPDGLRQAFSSELEAWGVGGDWLAWMEDDDPVLYLRSLTAGNDGRRLELTSPVEAEAICLGPRDQTDTYDLFISDGDGTLFHFWLQLDGMPELIEVRRLWINMDVTRCSLEGRNVVIDNGPLGVTAYARSEELDPILSAGRMSVLARDRTLSSVFAAIETEPVGSAGDAADDPVILPAGNASWIVGTDKRWGLHAYDLNGNQVASVARGRLNNVDAVTLGDGYFLAASNRTEGSIDFFSANPVTGRLDFLRAQPVDLNDPYGLCVGRRGDDIAVFIGGTDGEIQFWTVSGEEIALVETLLFGSQTEGCVYDEQNDALYVGEEAVGIWQVAVATGERALFAPISDTLVADVEGLDICHVANERVLIGSSQGDDSYVIWPLEGGTARLKFEIVADPARRLDGASETDGLACSNAPMADFSRGLLVVQDGRNRAPDTNQNFKYVDWRAIEALYRAAD